MNKEELKYIKENYFEENVSLDVILEMIDQAVNENDAPLPRLLQI